MWRASVAFLTKQWSRRSEADAPFPSLIPPLGSSLSLSGKRMSYEITRRQSTFWDFTSLELVTRVHFIAKQEFGFVESSVREFRFEEQHPLLTDYGSAWTQIFVSSPAAQPARLLARIDESIQSKSGQWRSFAGYREPRVALEVLAGGYGSLCSVPDFVASNIASLLTEEGVRFTTISSHGPRGSFRAMIAGRNWVVAELFRVEELPLNEPLPPIARKSRSG